MPNLKTESDTGHEVEVDIQEYVELQLEPMRFDEKTSDYARNEIKELRRALAVLTTALAESKTITAQNIQDMLGLGHRQAEFTQE